MRYCSSSKMDRNPLRRRSAKDDNLAFERNSLNAFDVTVGSSCRSSPTKTRPSQSERGQRNTRFSNGYLTSFVAENHIRQEGIVRDEELSSGVAASGKEDVSLLQHLADQAIVRLPQGYSRRPCQLAPLFLFIYIGSISGVNIVAIWSIRRRLSSAC